MDPTKSFEDEILSINPEYDMIFSRGEEKRLNLSPQHWERAQPRRKCSPRKMKIISKMNQIIGIKPVGELPMETDWEDLNTCSEKETIALMRTLGFEPSIDRPPDERRTISTVPTNDDVIYMRNGHKKMSIFMSDSYFQLKPRSEPSFCTDEEDISAETSTTTDFSDDVNIYEPIPLSTSNDTEITTISADDSVEKEEVQLKRNPLNRKFDSGVSSDSCKPRSAEDNLDLSWRRKSPLPEFSRESRNGRKSHSRRSTDSGSASSSSNWWRSNDSIETRDENNWRVSATKPVDTEKKEEKLVDIEAKPEPKATSVCGSPLYKPKELFMKRKALMIQQVLAENQS